MCQWPLRFWSLRSHPLNRPVHRGSPVAEEFGDHELPAASTVVPRARRRRPARPGAHPVAPASRRRPDRPPLRRAGFGYGYLAGLGFLVPLLPWIGVFVGALPVARARRGRVAVHRTVRRARRARRPAAAGAAVDRGVLVAHGMAARERAVRRLPVGAVGVRPVGGLVPAARERRRCPAAQLRGRADRCRTGIRRRRRCGPGRAAPRTGRGRSQAVWSPPSPRRSSSLALWPTLPGMDSGRPDDHRRRDPGQRPQTRTRLQRPTQARSSTITSEPHPRTGRRRRVGRGAATRPRRLAGERLRHRSRCATPTPPPTSPGRPRRSVHRSWWARCS